MSFPQLFLLLDRVRTRAWLLPDARFRSPRAFVFLKLSSSHAYRSARACNLTALLVAALRAGLAELDYTASQAGLELTLRSTRRGLHLAAHGWPEKLPELVLAVITALYTCGFTEAHLATALEVHRKGLQSCKAPNTNIGIRVFIKLCT